MLQRYFPAIFVFSLVLFLSIAPTIAQTRPNVVVIVSDDAGFADFGFSAGLTGGGLTGGTSQVPTTNLDRLAGRGVAFTRGYVAATCQATRAAIVTGGYQNRIGNENVGNSDTLQSSVATNGYTGIPVGTETVFSRFSNLGYTTGAVGKWHLGANETTATQTGNRPQDAGVDEFYGFYDSGRDYTVGSTSSYDLSQVNNPLYENQSRFIRETVRQSDGSFTDTVVDADPAFEGQHVTNVFGDYAVDFIQDHHADSDPFFLYQAFNAPHAPFVDSPDADDPRLSSLTGRRRAVASNILTLDKEVGRILDSLDDPNGDGDFSDSIRDETLIVFVNDNGGVRANANTDAPTDNGQLRGQKGTAFEGGIRVPFIIAGAGIDPSAAGTVFNDPVHGVDILPTVIEAAGGNLDADADRIDGINLLPVVNGETPAPERALVHRRDGSFAVIKGDYKLLNANRRDGNVDNYQLFNVVDDVGETTNLINEAGNEALVEELKRDLTDREVTFDKQRFSSFNQTLESENINLNDRFSLRGTAGITNWSDADNWIDPGNSDIDTLNRRDGFAGAVLEFGTSDDDYVSNNDLVRDTGLEFILNKVVLNGDFDNFTSRSATIQGNDILFTRDLDSVGPELEISANNISTGDFSYNLDLNLVLYDDLTITGDGNSEVNINGIISQYADRTRNLTKNSAGKVILTGENTFSGNTLIERGVLALSGAGSISSSVIIDISEGAEFDVSARNLDADNKNFTLGNTQTLTGEGLVTGNLAIDSGATVDVGTGTDYGTLTIDGDLALDSGSNLVLEIGKVGTAGTDYDQLIISGDLELAGNLRLVVDDATFTGQVGDVFSILNVGTGTFSGAFDTIETPTLRNGLAFDLSAVATTGELRIVAAVPEPSATVGLSVLLLAYLGRRRKTNA